MRKTASVIRRWFQHTDTQPIPDDVAYGNSMKHKRIWQHLVQDRPIHCRRTLDQYGYPNFRDTAVRDRKQTLYKRAKSAADAQLPNEPHRSKSRDAPSNLDVDFNKGADYWAAKLDAPKGLMVDQLWLFIIDSQTAVTFFAPKEREDDDCGVWRESDKRFNNFLDIDVGHKDNAMTCLTSLPLLCSTPLKASLKTLVPTTFKSFASSKNT